MPNNSSSSLQLTNLDFSGIKDSLKLYLQSQDIYKDYDFEGSNLNVLLDVLAYNSYKNAFLTNMLFSESWLDSAQLRASVLSRAKELNYLTYSKRSSKANITVNFQATGESQPYVLQKGSSFSALVKSKTYVFSIPETITVSSINNNFTFTTDVFEGIYLKDSYVYNSSKPNTRFKISNRNVDISSISVLVFEDNKLAADNFTQATTLLNINEVSKVFFLQASDNGYYEILFGDGVLGYKPKDNAVILIDYRVCNDTQANGAKQFGINFDPTGENSELTSQVVMITNETATGGAAEESLDSVKYYAPRHFQVQERAVVASDYAVLLKQAFPEINAISVIGGEDMIPAKFGKVFISVDISNVTGLPESKKNEYLAFIKRKMNLSIQPRMIIPEYTYYSINGLVRYNQNVTSSTSGRIKAIAVDTINTFDLKNLNNFDVTLEHSRLEGAIDNSDPSIISTSLNINVYKKIQPKTGIGQNITLNFGIEIDDTLSESAAPHSFTKKRSLSSSFFTYNGLQCVLEDDDAGNINISKKTDDIISKVITVGSLDYVTGKVQLTNFTIDAYDGNFLKIFILPKDRDITISKNNILKLEQDEINLKIEALRK
jgi:hypothetical protein